MLNITYADAIAKVDHLKAIGETEIYLTRDDGQFPYDRVTRVEEGSSFRLSGPSSCRLIAEQDGLTFNISVDFEGRDANGRGVSLFDRDRLRELMMKLPKPARLSFAELLRSQVMPPMRKRTTEFRQALRDQADSEDCVRGLIAFAEEAE